MNRGGTSQWIANTALYENLPVHLVSVSFSNETIYMNDSPQNINFNDGTGVHTYIGASSLLGFSDIEESVQIMVSKVTISLSGVDQVWIGKVLSQNYMDREVKIFTGFLSTTPPYMITNTPILVFEGRIDQPLIEEDFTTGKSTVSISATNSWVDFERDTGRHFNNEEQQVYFAGDKGLEYTSRSVEDVIWGKP